MLTLLPPDFLAYRMSPAIVLLEGTLNEWTVMISESPLALQTTCYHPFFYITVECPNFAFQTCRSTSSSSRIPSRQPCAAEITSLTQLTPAEWLRGTRIVRLNTLMPVYELRYLSIKHSASAAGSLRLLNQGCGIYGVHRKYVRPNHYCG